MSREENLHHRKRMKRRGRKISRITYGLRTDAQWPEYRERASRRFVKTRKPCSCSLGCGNPRNHTQGRASLTRDEQLAELSEREQMEEFNNQSKEAA